MAQSSLRAVLLLLILVWTLCTSASQASERPRNSGFIGYGITMYKPACAQACRDSVTNPLNCSGTMNHSHMVKRMGGMSMNKPSPECYAADDRFLQSVAYCISQHCEDIATWKLEQWWTKKMSGAKGQPQPKESYQEALANVATPPNVTIPADEMLMDDNTLVDEETWLANWNADYIFEENESTHVRYGLALLTTGAAIPIALSLLRFIPFPKPFISHFNAVFIDPPVFGTKHNVASLNNFIAPTRGQAFFITYLWIINIVLCCVGYQSRQPMAWYSTRTLEVESYVSYRTGVLSFSNIALLVLYAGRNNLLLWVTNWSHATFLLLHRSIAFICTLQACIHSALLLHIYATPSNGYDYASEVESPYWIWGIVATLGLVILLPTSILPIRQRVYEIFLAWHRVVAFFVLLGGYWHVVLCFGHQWGYETWLLIAFACWGFDHLMRGLRIARNGFRTATVTIIDEDYIRLDIPGIQASGQAYLYFPTLTWRVWNNHPFSVASSLLVSTEPQQQKQTLQSSVHDDDPEKLPSHDIKPIRSDSPTDSGTRPLHTFQIGLTFFIRTHNGTTSALRNRRTLPVLIESSYGHNLLHAHPTSCYPNLVCIAGGVGITAILPYLANHIGRSKLYWGVRKGALVDALYDTLAEPAYAGLETQVTKGERMDLKTTVKEVVKGDQGRGTMIVVSGPPSMADDVRRLTSRFVKEDRNVNVKFVEESYSW